MRFDMHIQLRLVYCTTKRAPTTATIGKVGFQSKQWIGCRPNHSVVYTAKVGVRRTSLDCSNNMSECDIVQVMPSLRNPSKLLHGPNRLLYLLYILINF